MDNQTARSTVLHNGTTVVTRTAKDAVSTDIAIKILAGSRDEVADNDPRGKKHFDEHMVCAGSENYPTRARRLIQGMKDFDSKKFGHHFTPATQFYFTKYDACVPAASTHDVLDIMVDMISRPLYRKRDVEVERNYILHERLGNQISFNSGNLERWIVPYIAHGENPLLYPVIGNKEGIEAITADNLRDSHARNVTGDRTVIAVEGDVTHDAVVEIVEKTIGLLPGKHPPVEVPVYTGGDVRYWLPGDGGAHVVLAFKAPPEGDFKAGIAYKAASELLTAENGKHSILETLRSDDLGAYDCAVSSLQMFDTGLFAITFKTFKVESYLVAIQEVMSELTERVDAQAFALFREKQQQKIKDAETLFKVGTGDMADDIFLHGKVMPPDHYARLRLQVMETGIKNAMREILSHSVIFAAAGDLEPLPSRKSVRSLFLDGKETNYSHSSVAAPPLQQYAFL